MSKLVSMSAAARAMGIDKSVLSRYLAEFPGLIRGKKGRAKLVDAVEVRAHREQNINAMMSDNYRGGLLGSEDASGGNGTGSGETFTEVAKAAKGQLVRLDLAERLEQVVETGLVEGTIAEVGLMLMQSLEGRNRLLGDELATMNDPRLIAARLKESDREILEKLSDAFIHTLRPDTKASAA